MAPKIGSKSKKIRGKVRFGFPRAVESWESNNYIRERLKKKLGLPADVDGKGFVAQSMANIKVNFPVLVEYTKEMQKQGVTRIGSLAELAAPLAELYDSWDIKEPFRLHTDTWAVKRLLNLVYRKWHRDESPRAPYM